MSHISYELAKELKDAGFPQNVSFLGGDTFDMWTDKEGSYWFRDFSKGFLDAKVPKNFPVKEACRIPRLEELIETCGKPVYLSVEEVNGRSVSVAARKLSKEGNWLETQGGSTPEEAVARLWLALNKK